MDRSSQKTFLPILVIGSNHDELMGQLAAQNRNTIGATSLSEGVDQLKFGSFVTILCDWNAIRNVPCDASICQIIRDINRLGLPLLIHSPKLAVGLRFQHWNGFCFYHFRTELVSHQLPKLERLALQLAVKNYPRNLPAVCNGHTSFDPESGWSLAPPAPHFRIADVDSSSSPTMWEAAAEKYTG